MLEKMSKQIDDQRCDPLLIRNLPHTQTGTRQADTIKHGSTSKLYGGF